MTYSIAPLFPKEKKIIASLGGGFSSSALMPRLLAGKDVEFINCVLPNEHPDTWRLFDAVEATLGISITYIAYHPETRWQYVDRADRTNKKKLHTPFRIFMQQGFIGNSRNDPCSSFLKRETVYHYVSEKYHQMDSAIAVGIHSDEIDRSVAIAENWQRKGWEVVFPLIDEPKSTKEEEIALMKEWYGVSVDLYEKGFEHNNCHGACVKAGQRQWAMLWYYYPDVFAEWEEEEQEWNRQWADIRGKNYYILKRMVDKQKEYISLKRIREEVFEPAISGESDNIISKLFLSLPSNPACMWCSAI